MPCLRNCPVWVAGQVGADGRCEDNCVSSDRFDSWALKPIVFIAACVSLLTASIDSIWNCVLSVAASTHMQSFVRFGWPAVDPLCVSSDRKRGHPQDRDDCYDCCVYYKYFFIRTYYSWQSCLKFVWPFGRSFVCLFWPQTQRRARSRWLLWMVFISNILNQDVVFRKAVAKSTFGRSSRSNFCGERHIWKWKCSKTVCSLWRRSRQWRGVCNWVSLVAFGDSI